MTLTFWGHKVSCILLCGNERLADDGPLCTSTCSSTATKNKDNQEATGRLQQRYMYLIPKEELPDLAKERQNWCL